ncbi:uncharacterized protein I303_105662 [Kwoniella dejecticola CBS 10117]|uniref:Uncharacterized protein n=1 Tax=Kwoniella dejecticola CBS 10117 TaxID=1296121 RepID=A0A1A6A023_9TREE|nr:uncharacterized protein I303_05684 [Kwoniella dejecticola CBS 10117]OBR83406.1 hypothetical protein I303_05684 [Kwoniella dejecticola CBS 10117]
MPRTDTISDFLKSKSAKSGTASNDAEATSARPPRYYVVTPCLASSGWINSIGFRYVPGFGLRHFSSESEYLSNAGNGTEIASDDETDELNTKLQECFSFQKWVYPMSNYNSESSQIVSQGSATKRIERMVADVVRSYRDEEQFKNNIVLVEDTQIITE